MMDEHDYDAEARGLFEHCGWCDREREACCKQYERDVKDIADALRKRDAEIKRLRKDAQRWQDHHDRQVELKRTLHNEYCKLRELKLCVENERDQLKAEIERLRELTRRLANDLACALDNRWTATEIIEIRQEGKETAKLLGWNKPLKE